MAEPDTGSKETDNAHSAYIDPVNGATVSVVLPAYMEENLEATVEGIRRSLADRELEMVVVTDHPDDPSAETAEDLAGPDLKHLHLDEPAGKGGAVLAGLRESGGDVTGFVDADGSIPPGELPRLVRAAEERGAAIASRNAPGARVEVDRSPARRIASRGFNLLVRGLFALPYADTQCGAKMFTHEALKPILDDVRCTGFEFDVEILWRLRRMGVEAEEVPIEWSHSKDSTFSLKESPSMLLNLLKLRIKP